MARLHFNWKRFWCPRGSNLNLRDAGYLPDPDSHSGRIWNPQVVSFDQISGVRGLVLLGDPGMGKSTVLSEQESFWKSKHHDPNDKCLFINLRSYQTDAQLTARLFEGPIFKEWLSGTHNLYLFLDSLDEGLLSIKVLAALLADEFKKLPPDRLYLRIACRTSEWPSLLENCLIDWLGKDLVKVCVLAPLRNKDVEEAARVTRLDAKAFVNQVESSAAVPFAIKPVTLSFLLSLYRKEGKLPNSQSVLYEDGCRLLAAESSESRDTAGFKGELATDQRLVVAARIATGMIFGNRNTVYNGSNPSEASDEDVTIRELSGGNESDNGIRFNVGEKEIRETLGTGLFSTRGPNRIGWGHQTYAEFLAAWYLNQNKVSGSQLMSLITHPGDSDGKIVPQLSETAVWLAGMTSEVFQGILEREPDLLLKSEVAAGDYQQRAAIVNALLQLYEDEHAFDHDRDHYKNLYHPNLAEQLQPYIADKAKGVLVRRVAIDIAEACNIQTLNDCLVTVALDPTDRHPIRVQAAHAILQIGETEARRKLKPLFLRQETDDIQDELKGCALRALWPSDITAKELFSLLTPPKSEGYIGAYRIFLSSELVQGLTSHDLIPALEFVTQLQQPRDELDSAVESLMDGIAIKAWESMDDFPGITDALGKFIAARLKFHDHLIKGRLEQTDHLIFLEDHEKRHRLLEVIFSIAGQDSEIETEWLIFMRPPLVLIDDFEWLISCLGRILAGNVLAVLVKIIERLFDGNNPNHLDAIYEASKNHPLLETKFKWVWEPILIGSDNAHKMKASYEEREKWIRTPRERPLLTPPPAERVAALLDECENRNIAAWWRLNRELTLEPNSTHYGSALEWDLTTLPGWFSSNEAMRARIIKAAKKYVLEADSNCLAWLGTNLIHEPAFSGYRALAVLLRKEPSFVSGLTSDVWRKWSPIILAFDFSSDNKTKAVRDELLSFAYRKAPDAFLGALRVLIEKDNQQGERIHITNGLSAVWDDQTAGLLLDKARDSSTKPKCMGSLLSVLLAHDNKEARSFANSLIPTPPPADDPERCRAIVAAQTLLLDTQDAGWATVWPAVQSDEQFGKEVLLAVSHDHSSIGPRLGEDQLVDLYVWLARHFEAPRHESGEAHLVGPLEEVEMWRNAIIQLLKHRGSFHACAAIARLQRELPELDWLKWVQVDAQAEARRATWVPSQAQEIIRLVADRETRLVRNGDQLVQVLVESLERLQARLQGETPEAQFLWDNVNKSDAKPKEENTFSDYIKIHLDKDLKQRGIVMNREVRIHRGERTDIHVNAVTQTASGESYDSITTIIECKGCWNPGLHDGIRDQLVGRYLKDNHCQHGLYLVGWFNATNWSAQDARKQQAQRICPDIDEARHRLAASASDLSNGSINVKSMVLDASLH